MTHRSRPEPFRHQETLAPYALLAIGEAQESRDDIMGRYPI